MGREINLTDQGVVFLHELRSNGVLSVGHKAAASIAASYQLTWPAALPGSTLFLQVDSSGVMSYSASTATLDTAYDGGPSITVDAGAVTLNVGADNTALDVQQTNAGRASDVVNINSDGTGDALSIDHSNASGLALNVTAGNVTLATGDLTVTAGDLAVTAGDLDVTAGKFMVGAQTPVDEVHVAVGAANARQRFTNTTTGHLVTDGFSIGIDSAGNAVLEQFEALKFQIDVNGNQVLTISGTNVGINQATPVSEIHLHDSGANAIEMRVTNSVSGALVTDGSKFGLDASANLLIENLENLPIIFRANGAEIARFEADGDLAMGLTVPLERLHVHDAGVAKCFLLLSNQGNDGFRVGVDIGGVAELRQKENTALRFFTNDLRRGGITSGGYWGIGLNGFEGLPDFQLFVKSETDDVVCKIENTGGPHSKDVLQIINGATGKHIDTDAGSGTPAQLTNAGVWTDATCFKETKNIIGLFNPLRALEVVGQLEIGTFQHKSDVDKGVAEPRTYLAVFQNGLRDMVGFGDDGVSPAETASLAIAALQGVLLRLVALETAAAIVPPAVGDVAGEVSVGNTPGRQTREDEREEVARVARAGRENRERRRK